MSLPKAAVVGGGATVLTAGTSYGIYNAVSSDSMPVNFVVLSKDSTTFDGDTKIGNLYGDYLISPFGKDKNNNQKWWEWSFRRWQEDEKGTKRTLSSSFAKDKIKSGYQPESKTTEDEQKSLNKVCKNVYEKTKTDITKENSDSNNDKENLRNDLWKYCSFFRETPKSIDEVEAKDYSVADTYGKKYASKLVGIKGNDTFWETRNKEFFEEVGKTSSILDATNDSLFKKLFDSKGGENKGNIRETCKAAYFLKETKEDNKLAATKDNVFKFCSLERKAS
ncbi:hypothetical protein [Candidatus Mycoplasma haematohominis]|uniref:Uncharacterized protein n=1 Tax=Candidatus Mycoplasma haematohominis TaxID=1494318 RepID=A0A478FQ32_9MOLU|nr:hypothetical protein [Candidatus Mycoplasma haemohominis]GCE63543.1 hypothetical protein MHSWG343_05400 [Candidatus Mycoplasma haemohominis]